MTFMQHFAQEWVYEKNFERKEKGVFVLMITMLNVILWLSILVGFDFQTLNFFIFNSILSAASVYVKEKARDGSWHRQNLFLSLFMGVVVPLVLFFLFWDWLYKKIKGV